MMKNPAFRLILTSILTLSFFLSATVQARAIIPAAPQLAANAYLLMDTDTGAILVEKNVDEKLAPASLTKMMTSYIVASELHSGSISENDMVNISVAAWQMGGSKMFVREGTQVPLMDLLRGVIIQSGNDASVALAEHVSGSESAFVDVMNQQAALLGMTNTHFENATGWPADGHVTTARDLALLGRALVKDFPEHYDIYSEKYFKFNGINQPNRNRLLFRDSTVDGIKTGHTEEAGFCLVSSAKKDGMRLISVVLGTRSDEARAAESQKLLAYGFRYFNTHKAYDADATLADAKVWYGKEKQVSLGLSKALYLTIPRGTEEELKAIIEINEKIEAPFEAGKELGRLKITLEDGAQLADVPLLAKQGVEEAGFFARLLDGLKLFFLSLFS